MSAHASVEACPSDDSKDDRDYEHEQTNDRRAPCVGHESENGCDEAEYHGNGGQSVHGGLRHERNVSGPRSRRSRNQGSETSYKRALVTSAGVRLEDPRRDRGGEGGGQTAVGF